MIHVHAEAEKNIRNVAERIISSYFLITVQSILKGNSE